MPAPNYPATTLREAITALDPQRPLNLSTTQDQKLFIDRESRELLRAIRQLRAGNDEKILFSGSRGNGKSTELSKLEENLKNEFWIVRFSVKDKLDVNDLNYLDILFSLPLQILLKADRERLPITGNPLKRAEQLQQNISVERTSTETAGVEVKGGLAESLFKLFSFEGRLAREEETRKTIRETVTHKISDLSALIGSLVDQIEQLTNKIVLVMIEDIDKADLATSITLFHQYGESLSKPPVHIIYTFPIALQNDQNAPQIDSNFGRLVSLENFRTHHRDNTPDTKGLACLKELLNHRISTNLIEDSAATLLVEKSGGIPRVLIQLARDAVIEADIDRVQTVTYQHAESAVRQYRASFARMLSSDQKKTLRTVHAQKMIDPGDVEHRQLLHNLSVLEYQNGGSNPIWYDVNPVVLELLN